VKTLEPIPEAQRVCATCKFKEFSSSMVDPCFPCLHEHSIWTGNPKKKYDQWEDERLSWDEINVRHAAIQADMLKTFEESPELQRLVRELFGDSPPSPPTPQAQEGELKP